MIKNKISVQLLLTMILIVIMSITFLYPLDIKASDLDRASTDVITLVDEENEVKKIKVGYYPVSEYQDSNEDGTYSGFGYDYFMQIQKYTRWEYEFVEANYVDCYKMLMTGEIDLMSGILKTDERMGQMLFSEASVSNTQSKFYVRSDAEIWYEDFEHFQGCKVAILRGTLRDGLNEYCEKNNFTVDVWEYDSMSECEDALMAGEVDMVFATSISADIDTKIVARLKKIPLYYAVNINRTDVLEELNDALQKIVDNNPNYYVELSQKYVLSGANSTATFTRDELEFIKSGQKVYVIINTNWSPISWYDAKEECYKGIACDVLEKIEDYSGIDFVYCTEEEFAKQAAVDPSIENNVVAILNDDSQWSVKNKVMTSNRVANTSVVMVTRRSTHQGDSEYEGIVALPRRFYISWCMEKVIPAEHIVYFDTVQDCLDAVNEGKADTTFVNELVATYYLSMLEYSNLFATSNTGFNENISFAVNKESDKPLLSIIDKSLLCINQNEISEIIIQNSIAEQRFSIKGLYYSNPAVVLGIVFVIVAIIAVIAAFIYSIIVKKKRMDMELSKEHEISAARTEFFMMISHEIRTPLNAVASYLNMAYEECKKQGIAIEYLLRSKNAAVQLEYIADEMLDYTKISTNSVSVKEEVFDIKELISMTEKNISVEAEKKQLEFKFIIDSISHEFVIGDQLRIAQIMQNILQNAIKFTDDGGKVIAKVSQNIKKDGNLELIFEARDTGRGMTEDFLEKVCEPFEQNDRAYSSTHGGLGLGLYLTKFYLSVMNGSMEVQSKVGEGSIFTLTIPLKIPDSNQIMDQDIDLSKIRALVAGKNKEDSNKLKDLLKRLKIKCDIVDNEDVVIKRIQSRIGGDYEYSLCILDEDIIGKDIELIDRINEQNKEPTIFVMTDKPEIIDAINVDKRVRKTLYKPIFQSVLFDAVLDVFGQYKIAKEEVEEEDFGGINAMIVEDNSINADILMRILKKVNIKTTVCVNGAIAVETFANSKDGEFDIIFMDIQMPVMDGYEATKRIRMDERGKTVPIVAISANAFPEDIDKSMKSGMNKHLSKPVKPTELYETIRKMVKKN